MLQNITAITLLKANFSRQLLQIRITNNTTIKIINQHHLFVLHDHQLITIQFYQLSSNNKLITNRLQINYLRHCSCQNTSFTFINKLSSIGNLQAVQTGDLVVAGALHMTRSVDLHTSGLETWSSGLRGKSWVL